MDDPRRKRELDADQRRTVLSMEVQTQARVTMARKNPQAQERCEFARRPGFPCQPYRVLKPVGSTPLRCVCWISSGKILFHGRIATFRTPSRRDPKRS